MEVEAQLSSAAAGRPLPSVSVPTNKSTSPALPELALTRMRQVWRPLAGEAGTVNVRTKVPAPKLSYSCTGVGSCANTGDSASNGASGVVTKRASGKATSPDRLVSKKPRSLLPAGTAICAGTLPGLANSAIGKVSAGRPLPLVSVNVAWPYTQCHTSVGSLIAKAKV